MPKEPYTCRREVSIPIPNRSKKRRIVEQVEIVPSKVDAMRNLQTKTAVEVEALLPTIRDRSCRGEL